MEFITEHNELLNLHVWTKTVDPVFHEKSAAWYELAFDLAHEIAEKMQDLGLDNPIDCDVASKRAMELLLSMQTKVEKMIAAKQAYGMDNLLRGFADKLDFAIGNAKAFIHEEDEEDMKPTEKWLKPKKGL